MNQNVKQKGRNEVTKLRQLFVYNVSAVLRTWLARCERVTKSVTNVVLYIPIDFSIEFWNCTFPQALKFLKGIFWTASARAFEWYKPGSVATSVQKLLTVFTAPTQLGLTIGVGEIWLPVLDRSRRIICHSFFFISTSKLTVIMRTLDLPRFYPGGVGHPRVIH